MKTVSILAAALAMAAAGALPAMAETAPAAPELASAQDEAQPTSSRTPMEDAKLGALSAGDSVTYSVLAGQQLTAASENNTIEGDVDTGDVIFGEAMNFAGVGNFVANTGANSNLQGSIMVNIVGPSPAPAP